LRSDNRHQLPSDPFVAKDALAYSLSSHWLGDMVNFSDHRLGNMPRKQKQPVAMTGCKKLYRVCKLKYTAHPRMGCAGKKLFFQINKPVEHSYK
ncbi:MAG: hypothetical protein PHP26_09160, partial [Syntrophomonas sp.]|uniref:hypothetical protein n=1 Tax=Syntrophomonas sp. TaxID=2053627 RepID=UPI00260257EC